MPSHDDRIDLLRSRFLRALAQRLEDLLFRIHKQISNDKEFFPVFGALTIGATIFLSTQDFIMVFTVMGDKINLWLSFLFLLGVQYGRVYWRRKS